METEVDDKYYLSEETTARFITSENSLSSLLYDGSQAKREGKSREYNDFAPTLSARDYKDPRMVNDEKKSNIYLVINYNLWLLLPPCIVLKVGARPSGS